MAGVHCFKCGGYGLEGEACPECGRHKGSLNLHLATQDVITQLDFMDIPQNYRGVTWHKDSLMGAHPELAKDKTFAGFATTCEKFHNEFVDGKLPNKSVIVVAPPKFGKVTLAYSCMQYAQTAGLTVAPLLDTLELKRVLVLGVEDSKYRLFKKWTYEDYILSDVVFVTVTKMDYRFDAFRTLMELIDRRNRKGLPTFVISRYQLNEITKWDRTGEFDSIKDGVSRNKLKYPILIRYSINF